MNAPAAIADTPLRPAKRTYSAPQAAAALVRTLRFGVPLSRVYLGRGAIGPELREAVWLAVTRVNDCAACARVHGRWAARAGLDAAEIDLLLDGDFSRLSEDERVAVLAATALAEDPGREAPRTALARWENVAGPGSGTELRGLVELACLANRTANAVFRD
jgi:AhpD family alkylhydroperoxidase